MAELTVTLLGGFACHDAAGAMIALPTRKAEAIVAYLAINAGSVQSREKLAGMLWGEKTEAQARANLRKTLSRLRQALPESARCSLVAEGDRVTLQPDTLAVDVTLFEGLARDGTPETLERAASLYRGEFLEAFPDCGAVFEDWLIAERRRLAETGRQVLQRLLDHYVVSGAIDRAIQVGLKLVADDPLQENVHRTLIRLYLYQERVGAALRQYEICRDVLDRDLGIEPAPETETLRAELTRMIPGTGDTSDSLYETDDLPERATIIESAAKFRLDRRAHLSARPSIAVLPFSVDDAVHRHLGDGMTEDIITELGRFRELDVIAPVTAFAFRNAAIPADRAGAELGTRYVLETSLRGRGEGLRFTVRLVETETVRQLWANRYDCAVADVFDIQDDMVRRIVGALVGEIGAARSDESRRKRPEDWQAYDFWLRGRSALRRADLTAIHEARDCFQKAVEKDPHFARAYVGLAMVHRSEWACFSWNHWAFFRKEAMDLARRAVELDDRDHQAHCMLALAKLYAKDYDGAAKQLNHALELNPSDADLLAHVAFAMALLGEHDVAVGAGRNALRLAPHHPEWYVSFVGLALFAARLYEEAIEVMATAPEAICDTPAVLAAAHAYMDNISESARHRDSVHRHYNRYVARGVVPKGMSCVDWLIDLNPFRRPDDAEHYEQGMRLAGFE